MARLHKYTPILFFIGIFVIIYFYFLPVQSHTVYGDDLLTFKDYYAAKSFGEKVNLALHAEKYRPVYGVVFAKCVDFFQKNIQAYYVFNVLMHTIVTFIFFLIVNLILESYLFSFAFAISFGLARFFHYFLNQLLVGGLLEGMSLAFFLGSLYFIIRNFKEKEATDTRHYKSLLASILLANMAMYTHERYIICFPFLLCIIFLYPGNRILSLRQKMILGGLAVASPLVNVWVKIKVFSIPFFVGTGNTMIEFSFSRIFSFLIEGILGMFQVNTGPEYLGGIQYSALPDTAKVLVGLLLLIMFVAFAYMLNKVIIATIRFYASKVVDASALKPAVPAPYVLPAVFLFVYFFLCMAPAIATIRLEQRWLTAAYAVFMVITVMSIATIGSRIVTIKYALLTLIIPSLLYINYYYLSLGKSNTYMSSAETVAAQFKTALDKNVIHPNTAKLYLWEKKKDPNNENGIIWAVCGGYLFNFYGSQEKQLIFVDSAFTKTDTSYINNFPAFDTTKDQIILLGPELKDITGEYIKDSMRSFMLSIRQQ